MEKKVIKFPEVRLLEQEASEWIVRFEREKKPSPQEIAELKEWMNRSPQHKRILIRYASMWNEMDLLSALMLFEPIRNERVARLQRLSGPVISLVNDLCSIFSAAPRALVLSTLAVLLISLGCLAPFIISQNRNQDEVLITVVGEQLSYTLADGSVLWLNTDSRVSVDYGPAARRIVLDRGEAYFKVAKDARRPFEVYAGSRLVRAVGTAFSVRKLENSIRVVVTEGTVELAAVVVSSAGDSTKAAGERYGNVTALKDAGETDATGNAVAEQELGTVEVGQSVVLFESESGAVQVDNIGEQELARQLSWRKGLLVFAGEPLAEVINEVGRYTSLKIYIADPELRSMRIGGQFRIGETAALFDALETGFGLKIAYRDESHVEIHGKR